MKLFSRMDSMMMNTKKLASIPIRQPYGPACVGEGRGGGGRGRAGEEGEGERTGGGWRGQEGKVGE